MGQSQKAGRRQARARRLSRKRQRLIMFLAALGLIAAIVVVVVLTRQPGYRDLSVLGKQPAIVQVFLPG
jgi:flagellar biosynthesis/type III secretory pathway M-ring protein FliF/YscJ